VDVVVVTIPQRHVADLPKNLLADTPAQTVVIDTGNYYPRERDGHIEPIEAGTPGRIALPVSGDDAAAKSVVLTLVDELGFDGIDGGSLDESWRQQPGSPVYTKDFDADGVRRALSEASRERTSQWRGTADSPGNFNAPA
jgi:predicted dinucleotide-binding enzyme